MNRGFSPEEEELYHKTTAAVFNRLRKTSNPADLLNVLRLAHQGFDRACASAPAAARAAVACRAGCDTCCHESVAVQAHEVLIAAEYIQTHYSPDDLTAVIVRAATHRKAHAARAEHDWSSPKTPCVLLREGSCSIYQARPEACRAHHSHSVEGCKANLAAGRPLTDVRIPRLHGRMFAVMLAIDQAAETAGFDGQAYDFGSALHEALTNGLCAVRWMQRQPAFPDSCREKELPTGEE